MNAREYFETVVMPIWNRLQKEPDALELQIAATIIIVHTADYLSKNNGQKLEDVSLKIERQVPEFKAIRGVANANKHKIVERSPAEYRGLTNPQQSLPNILMLGGKPITLGRKQVSLGTTHCYVFQDGTELPILLALEKIIRVLDQETASP